MKTNNHRILEYALRIIEYVAFSDTPVTFKDVCSKFDLSKSTLHNILQTLLNMNYLTKDARTAEFSVGVRCFEVGNSYLMSDPFYEEAKDIVRNLSIETNETTHLGILEGTDVIYLYKFDTTQPFRLCSQVGRRRPAHMTAIGKALLSSCPDEKLMSLYPEENLPTCTSRTISTRQELLRQIREIRETGVAYEEEESVPYIKCYATPVLDHYGVAIAAISIAMPIMKGQEETEKTRQALWEAKMQLESVLRALYH